VRGFKGFLRMLRGLLGGERALDKVRHEVDVGDSAEVPTFFIARTKLGESFFTRRLSPGTRRARVASLTRAEFLEARKRGWVR
jgi:hypothetical protein